MKKSKRKRKIVIWIIVLFIIGSIVTYEIIQNQIKKATINQISQITNIAPENLWTIYSYDTHSLYYSTIDTSIYSVFKFEELIDTTKYIALSRKKHLILSFRVGFDHTYWSSQPIEKDNISDSINLVKCDKTLIILKTSYGERPTTFNKLQFKSKPHEAYIAFDLNSTGLDFPYFCNIEFENISLLYATDEAYKNKLVDGNYFDYVEENWGNFNFKVVFY